ncbi:MAG: 50S ribosomal protein P1 [Nitrososphaerota archaeon]
MEYVYAALLLHKAGKKIDEASLTRVLEAAGATPDQARVKSLVAALSEVNIDEVLKQATAAPVAPVPVAAATPAAPAKEEKKEEEKKEEALAGLSALFG